MRTRTSGWIVPLAFLTALAAVYSPPLSNRGSLLRPYAASDVSTSIPTATSSCDPSNPEPLCHAYTFYQYHEYGVQAVLSVPNPTVASGSAVANFVDVNTYVYPSGDLQWIQTGWVDGRAPNGVTYSSPTFYVEWCTDVIGCPGTSNYYFSTFGGAGIGSTHTFTITVDTRFARWCAAIDGVAKGSCVVLTGVTGDLSAQAESHNSADVIPTGHVTNLQYLAPHKRAYVWYNWDGYGSTGADPPLVLTLNGLTAWDYSEN